MQSVKWIRPFFRFGSVPLAFLFLLLLPVLDLASQASAKAPRIPFMVENSVTWIDIPAMAQTLGSPIHWDLGTRQLCVGQGPEGVTWTEGLAWAAQGRTAIPLEGRAFLHKGSWYAPLESSLHLLGTSLGCALTWDKEHHTVTRQEQRDIVAFQMQTLDNGDMAEIRFSHKVDYETFYHPPHYLLRLKGVQGDSSLLHLSRPTSLVKKIIPIQEKEVYQVTFQVSPKMEGAEVVERDSGRTLQVLFRKTASVRNDSEFSSIPTDLSTQKKIRTIIIDPGHGGKDPGAIGAKAQEKDIALAVGLKLRDKLRKAGFIVRMTRDDDTFVELRDRPAMASKWEGDLFLSLHCNAVEGKKRRRKTEGFKVYILREAESEEDKAIARRENQAAELSAQKSKDEISPVEWILLENQLNQYTKKSERLAELIIDSYEGGQIRKLGSGAGQAGFMVLVGAFMPAALVELGFITHPDDEAILSSRKGQDKLASRLAQAIIRYRDTE
ncbi:MAG TPA: N-acetylmuramoyl-L-alanine amidase [Fibrobacteraceae bacterium]|nr:N-acetylmuramoyl-L-alanine amidase [Fibrobacteraceae bacterium]